MSENGITFGYLVWNTQTKKVINVTEKQIKDSIKQYNGVYCDEAGILHTDSGYRNLPLLFVENGVYILQENKLCAAVVGKFIEHKQKYYLLVNGVGLCRKVTESVIFESIKEGKITNVINSVNRVKLREGSLPVYTTQHKSNIEIDTVVKLVDFELCDAIGSPGVGQKFVGKLKDTGEIGIVKRTVSSHKYDNINEVLCYDLGLLFGVRVCRAKHVIYKSSNDWVISLFSYNFPENRYKFISAKQYFGEDSFFSKFTIENLNKQMGIDCVKDFQRMVIFDLITHQVDRHISNFAFYSNTFYPLFDNGRSLFWDVSDISDITDDIFSTFITNEHGYGYAYIDNLGSKYCSTLINPNVSYNAILQIFYKHYGKTKRAQLLSMYVFTVYKLIIGGVVNA